MKHITSTLWAILLCCTCISAQVQKKYQDKKHKNQTVVVKDSKDVEDIDNLDSEFNLDDFKVGEVVKITTEKMLRVDQKKAKEDHLGSASKYKGKRIKKKTKYSGRSLSYSKKKKKKHDLAFDPQPKKSKGKDYRKKCYKW